MATDSYSTPIVYNSGVDSITIRATKGTSKFEVDDFNTSRLQSFDADWIIKADILDFGSGPVNPLSGDSIAWLDSLGVLHNYSVLSPSDEPHYRNPDPLKIGLRIHSTEESQYTIQELDLRAYYERTGLTGDLATMGWLNKSTGADSGLTGWDLTSVGGSLLTTSTINNVNALSLDGTSGLITASKQANIPSNYTIFAVVKPNTITGDRTIAADFDNGASLHNNGAVITLDQQNASITIIEPIVADETRLIIGRFQGGASTSLASPGFTTTTGSAGGDENLQGFRIGVGQAATYFSGEIAEVGVMSRDMNSAEEINVTNIYKLLFAIEE